MISAYRNMPTKSLADVPNAISRPFSPFERDAPTIVYTRVALPSAVEIVVVSTNRFFKYVKSPVYTHALHSPSPRSFIRINNLRNVPPPVNNNDRRIATTSRNSRTPDARCTTRRRRTLRVFGNSCRFLRARFFSNFF